MLHSNCESILMIMQLLRRCRNTQYFNKVRTINEMHCHDYDEINKCVVVNYFFSPVLAFRNLLE
jgi:hypothetical protein